MITFLLALSVILLVFDAAQYTRFTLRYGRVTWKRTREGRHLMGHSRVLAVTLWATLILAVVPFPMWFGLVVQVTLFAWLGFEATRRNRLLTANQREAQDKG